MRKYLTLPGYIMDEAQPLATRHEMNNLYGNFLKALYTMFEPRLCSKAFRDNGAATMYIIPIIPMASIFLSISPI